MITEKHNGWVVMVMFEIQTTGLRNNVVFWLLTTCVLLKESSVKFECFFRQFLNRLDPNNFNRKS